MPAIAAEAPVVVQLIAGASNTARESGSGGLAAEHVAREPTSDLDPPRVSRVCERKACRSEKRVRDRGRHERFLNRLDELCVKCRWPTISYRASTMPKRWGECRSQAEVVRVPWDLRRQPGEARIQPPGEVSMVGRARLRSFRCSGFVIVGRAPFVDPARRERGRRRSPQCPETEVEKRARRRLPEQPDLLSAPSRIGWGCRSTEGHCSDCDLPRRWFRVVIRNLHEIERLRFCILISCPGTKGPRPAGTLYFTRLQTPSLSTCSCWTLVCCPRPAFAARLPLPLVRS